MNIKLILITLALCNALAQGMQEQQSLLNSQYNNDQSEETIHQITTAPVPIQEQEQTQPRTSRCLKALGSSADIAQAIFTTTFTLSSFAATIYALTQPASFDIWLIGSLGIGGVWVGGESVKKDLRTAVRSTIACCNNDEIPNSNPEDEV